MKIIAARRPRPRGPAGCPPRGGRGRTPRSRRLPENPSPLRHRLTRTGQALAIGGPLPRDDWQGDRCRRDRRPRPRRGTASWPDSPRPNTAASSPSCSPSTLAVEQVLYEPRGPIDYAYFPTGAVLSALTVMRDGNAIEVATVGNEGLVGHYGFGGKTSPHRVIVQVGDGGLPHRVAGLAGGGREGRPAQGPAGGLPHRVHGPGVAVGGVQRPAPAGAAVLPVAADDPRPGGLGRPAADARVPGDHAGGAGGRASRRPSGRSRRRAWSGRTGAASPSSTGRGWRPGRASATPSCGTSTTGSWATAT